MTDVEIDFVVTDSLKALALYEKIFEIQRVDVTNIDKGLNEVIFTLYGTRFHMLDENPEYQLTAPKKEEPKPMWVNIVVPDIQETFNKAVMANCEVIQPVTVVEEFHVRNAILMDPFGYVWMIHQMDDPSNG